MNKTFYVKTSEDHKIIDVISYPFSGYQPLGFDEAHVSVLLSGAYALENGQAVYHPEWAESALDKRISHLEDIVNAMTGGTTE